MQRSKVKMPFRHLCLIRTVLCERHGKMQQSCKLDICRVGPSQDNSLTVKSILQNNKNTTPVDELVRLSG